MHTWTDPLHHHRFLTTAVGAAVALTVGTALAFTVQELTDGTNAPTGASSAVPAATAAVAEPISVLSHPGMLQLAVDEVLARQGWTSVAAPPAASASTVASPAPQVSAFEYPDLFAAALAEALVTLGLDG